MAVISTNVSHPGGRVLGVGVFNRQKNASPWARVLVCAVVQVVCTQVINEDWIFGGLQTRARGDAVYFRLKTPTPNPRAPEGDTLVEVTAMKVSHEYVV